MKFIKEYQIPLDPSKLLEKAIRSIMNEIYKKQKFYPKRKAEGERLTRKDHTAGVQEKDRDPYYLSDFSDDE